MEQGSWASPRRVRRISDNASFRVETDRRSLESGRVSGSRDLGSPWPPLCGMNGLFTHVADAESPAATSDGNGYRFGHWRRGLHVSLEHAIQRPAGGPCTLRGRKSHHRRSRLVWYPGRRCWTLWTEATIGRSPSSAHHRATG